MVFVQYDSTVLYNFHNILPALNTHPSKFETLLTIAGYTGSLGHLMQHMLVC